MNDLLNALGDMKDIDEDDLKAIIAIIKKADDPADFGIFLNPIKRQKEILEEAQLRLDLARLKSKARREDLQRAEEENRLAVLKAASQLGVTPQVYEQMMLKQAGAKADLDIEIERVKRLAEIEIDKVKVMNENAANRQVKLALLASIQEAAKQYYDLRARRASRVQIDNAKRHLDDLERRWSNFARDGQVQPGYGNRY